MKLAITAIKSIELLTVYENRLKVAEYQVESMETCWSFLRLLKLVDTHTFSAVFHFLKPLRVQRNQLLQRAESFEKSIENCENQIIDTFWNSASVVSYYITTESTIKPNETCWSSTESIETWSFLKLLTLVKTQTLSAVINF